MVYKVLEAPGAAPCLNLSILLLIVLWPFEFVHFIKLFSLYTVFPSHFTTELSS